MREEKSKKEEGLFDEIKLLKERIVTLEAKEEVRVKEVEELNNLVNSSKTYKWKNN